MTLLFSLSSVRLLFSRNHLSKVLFVLALVQLFIIFKYGISDSLNFKNGFRFFAKTDQINAMLNTTARNETTRGNLNLHQWYEICARDFNTFCNFPLFPMAPDKRSYLDKTEFKWNTTDAVGTRLFGLLTPEESGKYLFKVVSKNPVELWLSVNNNWTFSRRIAVVEKSSKPTKDVGISNPIFFEAGLKYYIEILAAGAGKESVQVMWKTPTSSAFEVIQGRFLSCFTYGRNLNDFKIHLESPACATRKSKSAYFKQDDVNLSYIPHEELSSVLPNCDYKPSYTVNRKMKLYEAVTNHVVHTFVYPFPEHKKLLDPKYWIFPLEETEVYEIVHFFMESLQRVHPGKFGLKGVKSVERKKDEERGSRYLIELELMDLTSHQSLILSEYVFRPVGQKSLCYPNNFQWNRTVDVYLVVTAKNQGKWLNHFITNVERILNETNDTNLHVVIFDYNSPDIDLEKALQESSLVRYEVVRRHGEYSRTESFTEAINLVSDQHSIVFMVDLHLDIASSFIVNIRKHCIEGRMVYTPIIVNLACGASSTNLAGKWEPYGYGLVGMYKSDWDRSGGFPHHKQTWGGEDWVLIDQLMTQGLEFERMRTPYVCHYYHTKKGMWK